LNQFTETNSSEETNHSLWMLLEIPFQHSHAIIFIPQALGTAIASTKVMKAQQVMRGEDGSEVSESNKHMSIIMSPLLYTFLFLEEKNNLEN